MFLLRDPNRNEPPFRELNIAKEGVSGVEHFEWFQRPFGMEVGVFGWEVAEFRLHPWTTEKTAKVVSMSNDMTKATFMNGGSQRCTRNYMG